jgi:site-specific DNA-methyltransferase (adenine-specific)
MNQALAVTLHLGDCLNVLRTLPDASVDAVVTDPPAGINFMGKEWDHHKGGRAHWVAWMVFRMAEARRVIRPGGYALVWALPRTSHWTALAMEEAGWTIRDRISHLFGTGFPKSKSCLKPGAEDWWLCKAPGPLLPLEIEAGRIDSGGTHGSHRSVGQGKGHRATEGNGIYRGVGGVVMPPHPSGRWPANVCLSCECEDIAPGEGHLPGCPVWEIGEQSGESKSNIRAGGGTSPAPRSWGCSRKDGSSLSGQADTGTAARFYYQSKASRVDRNEGCEGMEAKAVDRYGECGQGPTPQQTPRVTRLEGNGHPTVKATALMQWLCRLVTPAGGTVLDPFMGSGSTGKACVREGFNFVGIEGEAEYLEIARRRIEHERSKMPLLDAANV